MEMKTTTQEATSPAVASSSLPMMILRTMMRMRKMTTTTPPPKRGEVYCYQTTTKARTRNRRGHWNMLKLGCSGLLLVSVFNNYMFYTRNHQAFRHEKTESSSLAEFWLPSRTTKTTTRHHSTRKTTTKHAAAAVTTTTTAAAGKRRTGARNNDVDDDDVLVDSQEEEEVTTHRLVLQQLVDIVVQEAEGTHVINTRNSTTTRASGHHQQQQQGTKWWNHKSGGTVHHHNNNDISNHNRNSDNYDLDEDNASNNNNDNNIRSWGCRLTQTPLIYIHIGKSGGGQVRARFAASSNNLEELLERQQQEERKLQQLQQQQQQQQQQLQQKDENSKNMTKAKAILAAANWFRHANNRAYFVVQEEDDSTESSSLTNTNKKVYFCNSRHTNFRVHAIEMYEGTATCHATTPLGQAVACPEQIERMIATNDGCHGCGDATSPHCRVLYLGHNLLGNELHWLPAQYLMQWWQSSPWGREQQRSQILDNDDDSMHSYLKMLMPGDGAWCPSYNLSRPTRQQQQQQDIDSVYLKCSMPLAHAVDEMATRAVLEAQQRKRHSQQQQRRMPRLITSQARLYKHQPPRAISQLDNNMFMDWSSVYASLPVLRTTILREPFSWLVSRFFWHGNDNYFSCNDIDAAAAGDHQQQDNGGQQQDDDDDDDDACQIHQTHGRGWANRYALLYIFYLCGEDCAARYELSCSSSNDRSGHHGKQTSRRLLLAQMEQQAANNLRQSFAVVGLLNETEIFYDMVASRVQYMSKMASPSPLLEHDQDRRHSTEGGKEQQRCKALYQKNVTFQNELMNRSPALAALHRLFHIGVQVNRFQIQELKQECGMTTTTTVDATAR
jgi:hypothetical protein